MDLDACWQHWQTNDTNKMITSDWLTNDTNKDKMITSDWRNNNKLHTDDTWKKRTKENNNLDIWNWRQNNNNQYQPYHNRKLLNQPTWLNNNNFGQPRAMCPLIKPFNQYFIQNKPQYNQSYRFRHHRRMVESQQPNYDNNSNTQNSRVRASKQKRKCNAYLLTENDEIDSEDEEELPGYKRQKISLDDMEKLFAAFTINDDSVKGRVNSDEFTISDDSIKQRIESDDGDEISLSNDIVKERRINDEFTISDDNVKQQSRSIKSDEYGGDEKTTQRIITTQNNCLLNINDDVELGLNNSDDYIGFNNNVRLNLNNSAEEREENRTSDTSDNKPTHGVNNEDVHEKIEDKRGTKRDADNKSTSFTFRIKKQKRMDEEVEEKCDTDSNKEKGDKEIQCKEEKQQNTDEEEENNKINEDKENTKEEKNNNEEESSLTNVGNKREVEEGEESDKAGNSNKKQKKIKRGLRLCSNITCYIEQILYNC